MDILRGEQVDDLRQHILQESEGSLLAHTEVAMPVRLARTREFRISRQHLFAMSRHLDFRNHLDVPFFGVCQQLADILLRVIPPVGSRRILLTIPGTGLAPVHPRAVGPPCRELRQPRITVNLQAPSGAVGQVQVHLVQLQQRHGIHLFHQEFLGAEMSGHVEVQSPVYEARPVVHRAAHQPAVPPLLRHLQEGL